MSTIGFATTNFPPPNLATITLTVIPFSSTPTSGPQETSAAVARSHPRPTHFRIVIGVIAGGMGFSILLLFAILMYLKYRRYRPRATGAIGKPQHILKLAKLEDSERPSFEHQEISYGHSKYKSHALLSVGIDCAPLFHQSGSPNSGSPDSAVRKWAIDAFPSRRRDSRPKSLSTIITGREYNSRYIHRRERSFTEPAMERSGALPSLLISPAACPRAYTPSMSAASPGTTSCATTPTHTDVISQLEQLQREVDMLRREQRNLAQGLRDDPPPSYVEGASSRTKDDR